MWLVDEERLGEEWDLILLFCYLKKLIECGNYE
jgi:hypothetical protein